MLIDDGLLRPLLLVYSFRHELNVYGLWWKLVIVVLLLNLRLRKGVFLNSFFMIIV